MPTDRGELAFLTVRPLLVRPLLVLEIQALAHQTMQIRDLDTSHRHFRRKPILREVRTLYFQVDCSQVARLVEFPQEATTRIVCFKDREYGKAGSTMEMVAIHCR